MYNVFFWGGGGVSLMDELNFFAFKYPILVVQTLKVKTMSGPEILW